MGQSLYPYYRLSHENEDSILDFIYRYCFKYHFGKSLYPYYRLSHENEDSILHFIYRYCFKYHFGTIFIPLLFRLPHMLCLMAKIVTCVLVELFSSIQSFLENPPRCHCSSENIKIIPDEKTNNCEFSFSVFRPLVFLGFLALPKIKYPCCQVQILSFLHLY